MANNVPVLEVSDLCKSYGSVKALDHVSLRLEAGRIYGLVGNNGAGKTTLFRLLTQLCFPTSGKIALFGGDSERDLRLARGRMGVLIEAPVLYSMATAEKNLDYVRILKGVKDKSVITEALETFGLADRRKSRVHTFSLGMKQRLGLAMTLIGNSELLLLDEPLNGLDPQGIREISETLIKLARERGVTIFISSHYLAQLSQVADEYIILNKGRVLAQFTQAELLDRCRPSVRVVTTRQEYALEVLQQKLQEPITLQSDGSILIEAFQGKVSRIYTILANAGIEVDDVETQGVSFEDYFLQITGGDARG